MAVNCFQTKAAVKQEHLVLDATCGYFVHKRIVVQLAVHQLEVVRFLNHQLREYPGIFLNDETGLGKCFPIIAFLSATALSERPSIIVCPNRERTYHWVYHLDVLSPSLRSRVHPKSHLEVAEELTALQCTDWQYAIVDETRGFMTTSERERLRALAVQKYIFLSSRDLLDESVVLSDRLDILFGSSAAALQSMIEQERKHKTSNGSFSIYLCTRRFILRRNVKNYRQLLPLITKTEFLERFNAWKVANDIDVLETAYDTERLSVEYNITTPRFIESAFLPFHIRTMTPEATLIAPQTETLVSNKVLPVRLESGVGLVESLSHLPDAVPVHLTGSEPLFDPNETNTEQMPPLRVESDTPSENGSIPEGGINIPETVPESESYFQFGQQISGGSTSTQPGMADEGNTSPAQDFFPVQAASKCSGSSLSVESLTKAQPTEPVITISSSDSPSRAMSPPLFEDTDNDTVSLASSDNDISLMQLVDESPDKCYRRRNTACPKTANERQPSFRSPIAKLMFGPIAHGTPQQEVDVSSVDMFADSPAAAIALVEKDNVFEITKNNAFANRIVVHETNEGALSLRIDDESSDDDVQFVDATGKVIDLDDASGTPKSSERNNALANQRTPPSGGLNLTVSPGRGWMGKSLRTSLISPDKCNTTPTSCRKSAGYGGSGSTLTRGRVHIVRDANRRRKLEELFKDVDDRRSVKLKECFNVATGSRTNRKRR